MGSPSHWVLFEVHQGVLVKLVTMTIYTVDWESQHRSWKNNIRDRDIASTMTFILALTAKMGQI